MFVITVAEMVIRDIVSPNYFVNSDRYGYKDKISTLIKYILADAKHPEIKDARELVVKLLNELHEDNPAFVVTSSQELISRYHGLSKNFEVVDVSHVLKTLEKIKSEIEALNTMINPTYKLVSLQRKILSYIEQVGVDLNTNQSTSFGKLRHILSSIKNPKSRFKLGDLKGLYMLSTSFIKDHVVKQIIEYQTSLAVILQENSTEYLEMKQVLGEYPWRDLSEKLKSKGKIQLPKTIKLDKHIDHTKEKTNENDQNAYQDGVVQHLNNAIHRVMNYVDKEVESILGYKKLVEQYKDDLHKEKVGTDKYNSVLKKYEIYKKEYIQKQTKSLFIYKETPDDILISVNPKAMKSSNLEDIRQKLLRGANGLFDTEVEIMQNLEVLNGRKTRNGISIGFLKELLNAWDAKDKQLQLKYRELQNAQGERNHEIEEEIETLITTISDYLIEKQLFFEPMNKDSIFITYMPKNNIQIIESQIRENMKKKNNIDEVIRKFLSEYTFTSLPHDKTKLQEGVLELLRRKNIHEQDKNKFMDLINKHFDILKENEATREQLLVEFEMPQRLISVDEESSIMKPIDTTKDMKDNILTELKEGKDKEFIEDMHEGKTPTYMILDKLIENINKLKYKNANISLKSKYEKVGDKHIIIIGMVTVTKEIKESHKRKIAISADEKFENVINDYIYKVLTEFAKTILVKIDDRDVKKVTTEILKKYLHDIKETISK
jgi:hypothetical protein